MSIQEAHSSTGFIFKITESSFLNNYAEIILLFSPNVQGTNAETTFRQHYVNIVAMSLPNVEDQHWDNVQALL